MIAVNQKVMFKNEVIKRCGHSKYVADMRGIILEVKGKICKIDTQGTYPNEEGSSIRWIPCNNLIKTIN